MPARKKAPAQSKSQVKDLKPKKNPKGGSYSTAAQKVVSADGSVRLGDGSVRLGDGSVRVADGSVKKASAP